MVFLLIEKELKNLLLSPKFVATFAACTVLILVSVFAGIIEYRAGSAQYTAATALVSQELTESTSWPQLGERQRIFRRPEVMQIFASGIHYDIGRFSVISSWQDVQLQQSSYSIEPIFAVFRAMDFVFIVQVVLSLLTIVFAYDLVSGEKESGTLRLMLANAVPRTQYIVAKLAGAWVGLMIPLIIPLLLGVLLLMLYAIPFTGDDWVRLAKLAGYSLVYLTGFLSLGVLFSTLTHRSAMSFLSLLVFWIAMVLVVPRGGMMFATQIYPVPSASEVESRKEGFARERRDTFFQELSAAFQARSQAHEGMSEADRAAYEEENEWDWMVEDDERQKGMESDLAEHNRQIDEQINNARAVQQSLGFALSRFSPASAYQLAAMRLGQTDLGLKQRFTDALYAYRTTFRAYIDQKNPGGMMSFGGNQSTEPLDLSDMPVFEARLPSAPEDASPVDLLVLMGYIFGSAGLALVAFNRYDVR
ncbi:MAG: ABC transporter permease subunit [Rhodothermales bacterium]|nr:ABC transporter permease subunit [Rhodothermales bacterium]